MKFNQKWIGAYVKNNEIGEYFPVTVPGNIQLDYGKEQGFGNVNFKDTCTRYKDLEDLGWVYKTDLEFRAKQDDKIYFVTEGIEYEYDVILNSKKLLHHTGMFSKVEIDITDELKNGKALEIYIYPHPKRTGADECREQADQSVKPAVGYGWDWHPRLLVSGIWNDTYIETRDKETINSCEISYKLSDDLKTAEIHFDIDCQSDTKIELFDMENTLVYSGNIADFTLQGVNLWWCNGQGLPYLYTWKVSSKTDVRTGKIGFKKIELVMNGEDAWSKPDGFPKTRSNPPITICINNREIFAKGSNWVNPEIFTGTITKETYETQLKLAKDANMNILRVWGGAIVNKEPFYELCDELGIMVWQEFPLACNNYIGTEEYLKVLEQEAIAIIKRIKQHVCLALWCGGNELFNGWSKMTDQSRALRMLNKLCYEYDINTPFIMTSPIMGMAHGHYVFYDFDIDKTVFEIFQESSNTAYTEFGIPSITKLEYLEKIIPKEELDIKNKSISWELHHAYKAWGEERWMCKEIIDKIFGKKETLNDYIEKSNWLQCEGYKAIFEEARRQKPTCSMALNWCYNEPWITAAGNSLITYPNNPKPAYYAVKDALRPVMPSAKIEHFGYIGGEMLMAELWYLNDSPKEIQDTVSVYIEIDGNKEHIMDWHTGIVDKNTNKRGHKICYQLPKARMQKIKLILEGDEETSVYELLLKEEKTVNIIPHTLNV